MEKNLNKILVPEVIGCGNEFKILQIICGENKMSFYLKQNRITDCLQQSKSLVLCEWMGGWVVKWMDGWKDGRAGLRIAHSNQNLEFREGAPLRLGKGILTEIRKGGPLT